jgi:hypothetical protein
MRWVGLILLLVVINSGLCEETPGARIYRIYQEARGQRGQENTNPVEVLWKLGRACFDWADLVKADEDRARIAEEGIAACREAVRRKYGSAPAHYYLAMDLGQLARTKSIGALKLVREMEAEFKEAIERDEKFDYAGPHRSLGLLYKDAPGWPTSVGSRTKSRQHLGRAVELRPDYPDNQLSLAEAYLEWGETKLVAEGMPALEELFKTAKTRFTGEQWELSWRDWEVRMDRLKAKFAKPAERAASPRGKMK